MKYLSWRDYTIQPVGSVPLHRPLLAAYLQRLLSMRRVGWRVERAQGEAVGLALGTEGAYFTCLSTGVESDAENYSPSGFLFLRWVNSALLRGVKSSLGGKGPEDGVVPCSPFPFPLGPLNGWHARDLMDSAR